MSGMYIAAYFCTHCMQYFKDEVGVEIERGNVAGIKGKILCLQCRKELCCIEFDLRDRVRITELEREGTVVSIWITECGVQYQVRYFDNAEARTVYFFEDELTLVGRLEMKCEE